jgi:hypothetical protein
VRSKATYTYTGTFRRRARSPRDRQRPAAAERCESGGEDASLGAIMGSYRKLFISLLYLNLFMTDLFTLFILLFYNFN